MEDAKYNRDNHKTDIIIKWRFRCLFVYYDWKFEILVPYPTLAAHHTLRSLSNYFSGHILAIYNYI